MKPEIKNRIEQIRQGIVPEGYKITPVAVVPKEWNMCHFREMFSRLVRRNNEGNTNVLTISAQHGLISQEIFFSKSIASDNKSNYFLLYRGEFAYNKSYSSGYPYGAIKPLEKYEKGIVSPLYICFSRTDANKCPEYYEQYFEGGLMNHEIKAFAQEGARNHGLLNISTSDFFNSYVLQPSYEEQNKIAEILTTQDKVIELERQKIEEIKKAKQFFLGKMFPKKGQKEPEIRFKGFTGAWEQRKLGELGEILTGLTPSTSNEEYYSDNGIPWVTPTDISENIIYDTPRKLSDEGQKIARIAPKGTILVTCIASIGKNTMLGTTGSFNQQINALIPNFEKNNPYFLLTESMLWSEKMKQQAAAGTMQIVNKTEFSGLVTMVPKLEEQEAIGSYFRNLDHLITLHQRKLDEEKQKKKALMQLLLTGIVRV